VQGVAIDPATDALQDMPDCKPPDLRVLAKDLSEMHLKNSVESNDFLNFSEHYEDYRRDMRNGKHGKTAQFWL